MSKNYDKIADYSAACFLLALFLDGTGFILTVAGLYKAGFMLVILSMIALFVGVMVVLIGLIIDIARKIFGFCWHKWSGWYYCEPESDKGDKYYYHDKRRCCKKCGMLEVIPLDAEGNPIWN